MTDVKWSMDDSMLVTASIDRVVRLWDAELNTSLAEFAGHSDTVRSVNWHPTNERKLKLVFWIDPLHLMYMLLFRFDYYWFKRWFFQDLGYKV